MARTPSKWRRARSGEARPVEAAEYNAVGLGRKPRIGMKKKQDVAGRTFSARVHLQRAPSRRQDDLVRAQFRLPDGRVTTAAVGNDYFGAERSQLGERIERRSDTVAFVQHGHDDREL